MAGLITDETGKTLWEGKAEAGLLAGKVDITLDDSVIGALSRVTGFSVELSPTRLGSAWFKPHGVMAVVGPFNFPAHLPNGHIVPALAMGNTIVFKPSEKTPAVGQFLAALFQEALEAEGAPPGVFNLVQGGAEAASRLVSHDGLDGILFTGSWPVGRRILEANLDRPSRIIALEMGGNNPAVVLPDADLRQAAMEVARCAFITTGQRCTCTRRLIVHEQVADRLIGAVCKIASTVIVGAPRAEHPVFMGPIISKQARDGAIEFQRSLASAGARLLVQATAPDHPDGGLYLTPGVAQVDRFTTSDEGGSRGGGGGRDAGCDVELFGPYLRVAVVGSLDEAIEQANATRYGLAASIFTQDIDAAERFRFECRAGCINVNTGTAGASSKLPFGGLGLSGNHRPAGSFSLDYCAYPVAGMAETGTAAAEAPGMRFDEAWLSAR
jgi:succinylglutamic semialdehyde dehydrogenase